MSKAPILSVLVPALDSRDWRRLVNSLYRQTKFMSPGEAEVLVELDGGGMPSGLKRAKLAWEARGDYLAFVDDDDEVSPQYMLNLVEACRHGPDVVTFNVQLTRRNQFRVPTTEPEVWRLGMWDNDRPRGRMSANHLCAWRRDLARSVGWCPALGYGDDQLWYKPLHASGEVRETKHLNRVLYHYIFDPGVSANQRLEVVDFARRYVGGGLRCFRHRSEVWRGILVEVGGCGITGGFSNMVVVRDCRGLVHTFPDDQLDCFHVATLE